MRLVAAAAMLLALPASVLAEDLPVDLELVLAIDVSDSIDPREARMQRDGYVAAFIDPEVIGAIIGGVHGRIALTYFEWAESTHQKTLVDWMVIAGAEDARRFADQLHVAPHNPGRWTSISGAISFAMRRFADNGYEGTRRVIDISGDGANNHGRDLGEAREEAIAAGFTINGLPIVTQRLSNFGWPRSADMDFYYEQNVIGGPGAFVVTVEDFQDFASAIVRKLVREIAAGPRREYHAAAE